MKNCVLINFVSLTPTSLPVVEGFVRVPLPELERFVRMPRSKGDAPFSLLPPGEGPGMREGF